MSPAVITPDPGFAPTTGLAGLDAVLRGVARGDNIVWQVQSLDDYRALVLPYAEAARALGRRLIYFRFAAHPPLLGDDREFCKQLKKENIKRATTKYILLLL